jgi:hypothetical protein
MGEWELFDLSKDPHELTNLFDHSAYSDVVEELKGELSRLRSVYRVPDVDPPAGTLR